MRLIDADSLKEDLRQYFTDGVLDGVSAKLAFHQIMHDIDNAPTVELQMARMTNEIIIPIARPTGEWINHYDDLFPEESMEECSICHELQSIGNDDNYCPNCGAKMKREKE